MKRQNVPHHHRVTCGSACNLWTWPKPVFQISQTLRPSLVPHSWPCPCLDSSSVMYRYLIFLPSWHSLDWPSSSRYFHFWLILCTILKVVSFPSLPNSLATLTTNLNVDLPLSLPLSPTPGVLEPKCTDNDRCTFSSHLECLLHLAASWWCFLWYLLQVPGDTGYDPSISCLPDTLQTLSLWVYLAFFLFCPEFMDVVWEDCSAWHLLCRIESRNPENVQWLLLIATLFISLTTCLLWLSHKITDILGRHCRATRQREPR